MFNAYDDHTHATPFILLPNHSSKCQSHGRTFSLQMPFFRTACSSHIHVEGNRLTKQMPYAMAVTSFLRIEHGTLFHGQPCQP